MHRGDRGWRGRLHARAITVTNLVSSSDSFLKRSPACLLPFSLIFNLTMFLSLWANLIPLHAFRIEFSRSVTQIFLMVVILRQTFLNYALFYIRGPMPNPSLPQGFLGPPKMGVFTYSRKLARATDISFSFRQAH